MKGREVGVGGAFAEKELGVECLAHARHRKRSRTGWSGCWRAMPLAASSPRPPPPNRGLERGIRRLRLQDQTPHILANVPGEIEKRGNLDHASRPRRRIPSGITGDHHHRRRSSPDFHTYAAPLRAMWWGEADALAREASHGGGHSDRRAGPRRYQSGCLSPARALH